MGWLLTVVASVAMAAVGAALAAGAIPSASSPPPRPPQVIGEAPATAMNNSLGASNNSPLMVADPSEPRFVVMANRIDAPDFGCALQVSGDAGRTWVPARPVTKLPDGAEKCYGPEVAFGADGNLYYLFVGLQGRGNEPMGVFLVTSADRGRSFSPARRVLGPLNFGVRMAIDRSVGGRGRLHLAWIRATSDPPLGGFGPPPNPILAAHSDDGGRSFSDPVQVSDPRRQRVVAPALALGPDRAVHVAYYDLGRDAIDYQGLEGPVWEEPWSLVIASSGDGGRRFTRGRVVDAAIMPAERVMLIFTMAPPALVAGPGPRVCAAWTDARRGDPDAFLRCSKDGGRSWSGLRRLNDDRVGNGARQYLPRLSVSPGGRLDAVFFDRRDDTRNLANHLYLTYSVDDGRSFAPNRRVSSEPSDTRVGAQYVHAAAKGQYEIGARLALLSQRFGAVAAWPDTRHSAGSGTGHDLFSATVALPGPARRSIAPRLVGGGLVLGAAALVAVGRRRRAARATPS